VNNESALKGLNYSLIGEIGGSSLRIAIGNQYLEISDAERESTFISPTAIMQGLENFACSPVLVQFLKTRMPFHFRSEKN
jgi:hypothetical protein